MSRSFFPLGRGEKLTLSFLVIFSTISFLPVWNGFEIAGMAVFGWFMVALMIISPTLALFALSGKRRR